MKEIMDIPQLFVVTFYIVIHIQNLVTICKHGYVYVHSHVCNTQ